MKLKLIAQKTTLGSGRPVIRFLDGRPDIHAGETNRTDMDLIRALIKHTGGELTPEPGKKVWVHQGYELRKHANGWWCGRADDLAQKIFEEVA
jgi:hypothetical protein